MLLLGAILFLFSPPAATPEVLLPVYGFVAFLVIVFFQDEQESGVSCK